MAQKRKIREYATAFRVPLSYQMQATDSQHMNQEDSMSSLALMLFNDLDVMKNSGMWIFLSIGAIALFVVFIPTVSWIDGRRKEREAFYRAETFRRLTESSAEGAKAAIDLLREQDRQQLIKSREGMKISGLICIGVGVALVPVLRAANNPSYLVGLIPAFVGVANLVYVFFLAAPLEQPKK
jgi:hypothetical protein